MRLSAAVLAATLVATAAEAREVVFPLVVDHALLRASLARQLGEEADGGALVWGTRGGCRSLVLRDLRVGPAAGRVRVSAQATAHLGFRFLAFCFGPLSWKGNLESVARPGLGDGWQLRLRDLDSHVYDAAWQRTMVASRLWDVAKGRLESELTAFAFDLAPPIEEAQGLIRASVEPARARPVLEALATLHPLGVEVDDEGVKVQVALDLLPADTTPPPPEPPLPPIRGCATSSWICCSRAATACSTRSREARWRASIRCGSSSSTRGTGCGASCGRASPTAGRRTGCSATRASSPRATRSWRSMPRRRRWGWRSPATGSGAPRACSTPPTSAIRSPTPRRRTPCCASSSTFTSRPRARVPRRPHPRTNRVGSARGPPGQRRRRTSWARSLAGSIAGCPGRTSSPRTATRSAGYSRSSPGERPARTRWRSGSRRSTASWSRRSPGRRAAGGSSWSGTGKSPTSSRRAATWASCR